MKWIRLFALLATFSIVGCKSATAPRLPDSDEDPEKPDGPDDPKNGMVYPAPVVFLA